MQNQKIIFFDGYCGLCNGVVDFMIERDPDQALHYAPLQGETARSLLTEAERNDLDSVVFVDESMKYHKSEAVLRALSYLSQDWAALTRAARAIPRPIRDLIYDLVAKNRFKLFGRRESCRAPSEAERKIFLP